jgi:hypothetical protein
LVVPSKGLKYIGSQRALEALIWMEAEPQGYYR